jgi:hypothetical protein
VYQQIRAEAGMPNPATRLSTLHPVFVPVFRLDKVQARNFRVAMVVQRNIAISTRSLRLYPVKVSTKFQSWNLISRDSFYRFKDFYGTGGELALMEVSRRNLLLKDRVGAVIETTVVELALEQPT